MVALNGLEQDACFEELRAEERFQAIVRKLKEGLEILK